MTNRPDPRRFAHVSDWVFDLDNTLYPHHSNLFSQIDKKMTAYVAELLKMPPDEARKLQKDLYRDHGTTLNGLIERFNVDPDDFLRVVHDIDYSWLKPDPELGEAIRRCPVANSSSPMVIAAMRSEPLRNSEFSIILKTSSISWQRT